MVVITATHVSADLLQVSVNTDEEKISANRQELVVFTHLYMMLLDWHLGNEQQYTANTKRRVFAG